MLATITNPATNRANKVVVTIEISGNDMTDLFKKFMRSDNPADGIDLRALSWHILDMAGFNTERSAFSAFENALDYAIGMKIINYRMAVRQMGKRVKVYRLAFTRDDMFLVTSAGAVIM